VDNHSTLRQMIELANRDQQYFYDSGVADCQSPLGELEDQLSAALEEVKAMRRHVHDWGEDDYCVVCGADGRV
jgi:hypothetical protein